MPYLKSDWMLGTTVLAAGTWVPERNWDRWQDRAVGVPEHLLGWRRDPQWGIPGGPISQPPEELPANAMTVLAGDIVSAQGDALLYSNFIERLKNSPSDTTADEVVDQMLTLGLTSAGWPEAVGGPPPHESPRPWRRVLDWLKKLAADVAGFLLRCVESAGATLRVAGVTAVAVNVSWPWPQVSFEFPTDIFSRHAEWQKAREFLQQMLTELRQKVFSA